jgi:hypothetical protein
MRDLERFWVILHIQDWGKMLADNRLRLYAGENCVEQFRASLIEQVMCRWPKFSVEIDRNIWPEGASFQSYYSEAVTRQNAELNRLQEQMERVYRDFSSQQLPELIRSGRTLRVMGITSRYTSFIQYSMRDWLAAFEKLGHQTKLLMETADHELPNNLAVASACAEFRPDLVVSIDHFREEFMGIPAKVPAVMWVQDRMPTIYATEAGQQQGRLDYTIGYSMLELTQQFGYPASRFLPTMMAVNESRFVPRELTADEIARYGCEVSFVSNATMSADEVMREVKTQQSPLGAKFLDEVYARFRGIYDAGGSITSGDLMRTIIVQTAADMKVNTEIDSALNLFTHRVNNSLFRHQVIRWVAEMGVDLHLYGKGWENHPEFAKYAKGIADNQTQLPTIYQASKINLQVTPFGAVHQRLLDGLCAGGFFLLKSIVADELELILREMDHWCRQRNIRSGAEMVARQDAALQKLTRRYAELDGVNPLSKPDYYFGALGECALSGYTRTANTLWENSERVTFTTREQLQSQIRHFLAHPEQRREIARSMRQRVLETHTYQSITRRLLKFISDDLDAAPAMMKAA